MWMEWSWTKNSLYIYSWNEWSENTPLYLYLYMYMYIQHIFLIYTHRIDKSCIIIRIRIWIRIQQRAMDKEPDSSEDVVVGGRDWLLLIQLLIPGDKVFQFLQQLGAKSRELSVLNAGVGRQIVIIDVVTGIASSSDHYDLIDLVEKQNWVQKRKQLQKKTIQNYFRERVRV